jgi:hypothetical protein
MWVRNDVRRRERQMREDRTRVRERLRKVGFEAVVR